MSNKLDNNCCGMCGHPRVKIKKGLWLCPGLEGSGLHYFGGTYGRDFEEFLKTKNCTLKEYREGISIKSIRKKKLEKLNKICQK